TTSATLPLHDALPIYPFKRSSLTLVDDSLKQSPAEPGLTGVARARQRFQRLHDAETALAAVINFHDSRREQKLRDDNPGWRAVRSDEHTSELQSRFDL